MTFVKVLKNKAYFKNYQVKYRRRREGKTDYKSRRALIVQDVNKYNAPKHRFVVRRTNKRIICQVIYSTIEGDRVVCSAESTELPRFGVPAGLTNYAAAYCTGLLCARRLMKQLGLDHSGVEEVTGEEYHQEDEENERRPFKAFLDVGLVRTTTGNRVFGAMKGACDGGLYIPHSVKRFPGWTPDEGNHDGNYEAETHRNRIMGQHVSEYMKQMKEDDEAKFKAHFAHFLKAGIEAEGMEAMYQKAHAAIRANPEFKKKDTKKVTIKRDGHSVSDGKRSWVQPRRMTKEQRHGRVQQKIKLAVEAAAAAAAAAESDEE